MAKSKKVLTKTQTKEKNSKFKKAKPTVKKIKSEICKELSEEITKEKYVSTIDAIRSTSPSPIAVASISTPVKLQPALATISKKIKDNLINNSTNNKSPQFVCEWKNCQGKFVKTEDFYSHVSTHLEEFEIVDEKYICLWGPCVFTSPCSDEITRHLHYHGYQRVLTAIGDFESYKANIPKCSLNPENRNLLPELKENFICRWGTCDRNFKSIEEFHRHVECHVQFEFDISKSFENQRPKLACQWEICQKTYDSKYRMSEHLRKHSNERLIGCSNCGTLFRTKTILFDHCRRQISNNTHQFQCAQCYKYFASERLLRCHVSVHVHCFKCSLCDMSCNSAATLAVHFRHRHLKDRPYECCKCKYTCITKSDLQRHDLQVHCKKFYQCEEDGCSYTVRSLNLFRKHYADVHDNNPAIYMCHCCGKVYKRGKSLTHHLINKHDFQLPSGHNRFTFRIDENGFHRLETTRIESLEVSKQIMSPIPVEANMELSRDSCAFEIVSKSDHPTVSTVSECDESNSEPTFNAN